MGDGSLSGIKHLRDIMQYAILIGAEFWGIAAAVSNQGAGYGDGAAALRGQACVDAMLDTMWRLVKDEPEFLATVEIELAR
ncbi:hypothetical protein [Gluconobacter sphaericus]|uniref:Uncharacterized protein n=1 Tax=Gluconobacter sphaericus NBRC 12467 TaxID=1307951 RepID=A0AA37SFD3_9PROT|nr:hypothetical protein [Gluconobacter sphaericus]GBR51102.1 hypothetical protein AA12467_0484 [Gluconobacter sphaericus NBRC 12467]GEB41964.1 hypothetical protein GSP01_07460 [Gluconobacter sphaericus NBRC 12467]GLQ84079.1 hypothetical protein GCM10007872_09870 [Gluconobacter sphaericus NBRC 12467]